MTTYNIAGGGAALQDMLGVPLTNATVIITPHATTDALVTGSVVKFGSQTWAVESMPDPVVLDAGLWDIRIVSNSLKGAGSGGVRGILSQQPTFRPLQVSIDLTANTTWAAVASGAISDLPLTPSLVQQAQTAATNAAASATAAQTAAAGALVQWARNPDALITGAITRDSNGAATSAPVTWPDGAPGTYTADTVSTAFPGAVDAYHITYGSPVTKTITQPAVTRDSTTGAVTNAPAMVVT